MTTEKTISGTPLGEIPNAVLREFWLNDSLSTEDYMAESKRREQAYLSVSRDDVEALLTGFPKERFTAALIRMASWFEGRPVEIDRLPYAPSPQPNVAGAEPHPDDIAVDRFTAAMAEKMKLKLAKKREQGVTGWDDPEVCHIDYLVSLLLEQIHERAVMDPIDIANIAMMIHQRGETPSHGR